MSFSLSRRNLILFALTANLLLACTLSSRGAYACSCASSPSNPEDDLRASDAVFFGEVLDVEENASGVAGGVTPNIPVRFLVEGAWKGIQEQRIVVLGGDGMNCGPVFSRGERYLIYADRAGRDSDETLAPEPCGPTKPLIEAQRDLGALGPPAVMLSDAGQLAHTGGPPVALASALVVVLAFLSVGVLPYVRRRTRA